MRSRNVLIPTSTNLDVKNTILRKGFHDISFRAKNSDRQSETTVISLKVDDLEFEGQ